MSETCYEVLLLLIRRESRVRFDSPEADVIRRVVTFLNQLRAELGVSVEGLTPNAMAALRVHKWPGNLRELQSTLRQAMLEATGPVLTPDLLSSHTSGIHKIATGPADLMTFIADRVQAGSRELHAEWLARVEPVFLRAVLGHFHGNITRSAEALGLNRMTLRNRLRLYGIRADEQTG